MNIENYDYPTIYKNWSKMNKSNSLSFHHASKNKGDAPSWQRHTLKLNRIILEAFFSTKKLLRHLFQSKYIAPIASHLNVVRIKFETAGRSERGDVPGWVLVVLMTTGLVTGIWTVAQPRLSSILKNSLDNMNSIR